MSASLVLDAVRRDDAAALERLLGEDPRLAETRDDNGVSAVLLAVYHGHPELVPVLRRAGRALDAWEASAIGDGAAIAAALAREPESLHGYSPDGWTPLHLSVFFGHPDAAAVLLERGADLESVSRNAMHVSPLQSALASRQEECVALLLEHGAGAGGGAPGSWPPLLYAAANGLERSARLLLERGADPEDRGPDGQSPLEVAREKGHHAVASLLERHGTPG